MATYVYVNYSALERKTGEQGWNLSPTEQQINDAALEGDSWMKGLVSRFGLELFEQDTLSYYATEKAACAIGTTLIGGMVRDADRPLYMTVCDRCNNFEKEANNVKPVSRASNSRLTKGVCD